MSDSNQGEPRKKIGELLIENGYVTAEQVSEALNIQKRKRERIANILIDLGYMTEADLLELLGAMPGAASIELSACEIEREILDLVPAPLARNLELVPIGKLASSLTVAMVCPLDQAGRDELEDTTGLKVRPVLCSRGAVHSALDRYYSDRAEAEPAVDSKEDFSELEDTLKLRRIAQLVEEIGEIPTLPNVIHAISEVVNDPDSSAADLAKVILADVGLSAKILKLANSAAFGFSREISDIKHAVALLGFRQTQELAMSIPVFENLIKLCDFDFQMFWNHSLRCAKLSKLLSMGLTDRSVDSAFVGGLLHDIGQIVFAMSVRGKQEKADALGTKADISPIAAEEEILGSTGFCLRCSRAPFDITTIPSWSPSPRTPPE